MSLIIEQRGACINASQQQPYVHPLAADWIRLLSTQTCTEELIGDLNVFLNVLQAAQDADYDVMTHYKLFYESVSTLPSEKVIKIISLFDIIRCFEKKENFWNEAPPYKDCPYRNMQLDDGIKQNIDTHIANILLILIEFNTLKMLPEEDRSKIKGRCNLILLLGTMDNLERIDKREWADFILMSDAIAKKWYGLKIGPNRDLMKVGTFEEKCFYNYYQGTRIKLVSFCGSQKQRERIIQFTAKIVQLLVRFENKDKNFDIENEEAFGKYVPHFTYIFRMLYDIDLPKLDRILNHSIPFIPSLTTRQEFNLLFSFLSSIPVDILSPVTHVILSNREKVKDLKLISAIQFLNQLPHVSVLSDVLDLFKLVAIPNFSTLLSYKVDEQLIPFVQLFESLYIANRIELIQNAFHFANDFQYFTFLKNFIDRKPFLGKNHQECFPLAIKALALLVDISIVKKIKQIKPLDELIPFCVKVGFDAFCKTMVRMLKLKSGLSNVQVRVQLIEAFENIVKSSGIKVLENLFHSKIKTIDELIHALLIDEDFFASYEMANIVLQNDCYSREHILSKDALSIFWKKGLFNHREFECYGKKLRSAVLVILKEQEPAHFKCVVDHFRGFLDLKIKMQLREQWEKLPLVAEAKIDMQIGYTHFSLDLDALRKKAAEETICLKDIPEVDENSLDRLKSIFKTIHESSDHFKYFLTRYSSDEHSYFTQAPWYKPEGSPDRPIESYTYFFYVILKAIWEASSERPHPEELSAQEEMVIELWNIITYQTEQTYEAILEYYNRLPAHYRMDRHKVKAKTSEELVKGITFQSIQKVFNRVISRKDVVLSLKQGIDPPDDCKEATYSIIVKNRLYKQIGILHFFSLEVGQAYEMDSFRPMRTEEMVKKILTPVTLKELVCQVKRDWEELLPDESYAAELIKQLEATIPAQEKASDYLFYCNDKPQRIENKCALFLLEQSFLKRRE